MVWTAPDPDLDNHVRASFASQGALRTMGAELERVEPGLVEVSMPFDEKLSQINGFVHGGFVAALADTACGYAAYTVAPPFSNILTVEFKINLLAPARGSRFRAIGRVLRSGKTLTICQADVFADLEDGPAPVHVAIMIATLSVKSPGEMTVRS